MKKKLAEALKETSGSQLKSKNSKNDKNNNTKRERKTKETNNNSLAMFKLQFAGEKNSFRGNVNDQHTPKMVYADVVRNSILGKIELPSFLAMSDEDSSESMATSKESTSSNVWTSESDNTSLERSCGSSIQKPLRETTNLRIEPPSDKNIGDNNYICKMLAKLPPEALEELDTDETAWEVVSVSDWSQCGSDLISEDQFQVVSEDEHATTNENDRNTSASNDILKSQCKSTKLVKENENSKTYNDAQNKVKVVSRDFADAQFLQKKKVLVCRKYIGGPDFMGKLEKLNFEDKGKHEVLIELRTILVKIG